MNVVLGYQGLLFQDFLGLCLSFFFFPSDRPTQYQETHSTLNERKKGDGLRSLRLKTAWSSLTMGQFFMKRAKEANIIATRISLDVGFRELKNAL